MDDAAIISTIRARQAPAAAGNILSPKPSANVSPLPVSAAPDGPEKAGSREQGAGSKDPIVRTRPEKFGRAVYVEEVVPSRTPPRSPPPDPAEEGAGENTPLTLAALVNMYRVAGLRPLRLGKFTYLWIKRQPDRSQALKEVKAALVADDQIGEAGRVDRFLAVYWIARLLGPDDAQQMRMAAIRELRPLVARNMANEEWGLRTSCEPAARALWSRMVSERLTAAAIRSEVRKIRPSRSLKMHGRRGAFVKLLKEVARLKRQEEISELFRLIQEKLSAVHPETAVA
jgi:hypothetical protein